MYSTARIDCSCEHRFRIFYYHITKNIHIYVYINILKYKNKITNIQFYYITKLA